MGAEALETQAAESKPQPAAWVLALRAFGQFGFRPFADRDPCGTPLTIRQLINTHKILVSVFYVAFILYYQDGSLTLSDKTYGPAAMVLLVCHTTYGVAWVVKDVHFPDPSWRGPMTVLGFIVGFIFPFATYYLPMFCLVSRQCPLTFAEGNELGLVGIGLACYIVGFFYHFCSDIQKHFVLKYQRPRSLITDGVFAHSRNPNYFGEVLLYVGYGIMSCSWFPFIFFVIVWLMVFVPNMLYKEASMSRYAEWDAWKARSGFMFPWIPSLLYDILINGFNKSGIPEDQALLV